MHCQNINECFEHISSYYGGENTGYPLLVNTECFADFQNILQRLEADANTHCIYVSNNTLRNGLPDIPEAIAKVSLPGDYALIGVAQALMLRSSQALETTIDELLGHSIRGHAVILLLHSCQYLEELQKRDLRLKNRIVLLDGIRSQLPHVRLVRSADECLGYQPLGSIKELLDYLERADDNQISARPVLSVLTSLSPSLFQMSLYSISESAGIYGSLCQRNPEIAGGTTREYGTEEQWKWLADELCVDLGFTDYLCQEFGSTINLASHLSNAVSSSKQNRMWLLWLGMKIYGVAGNKYLTHVLGSSTTVQDFEKHVYLDILDCKRDDPEFTTMFDERKHLLGALPEDINLISQYCAAVGKHEKEAIYYLTDGTEQEEFEFMRCMSTYSYTEEEILIATKANFPSLHQYLGGFAFDSANTKLPEKYAAFRDVLTRYFHSYRLQKLSNRLLPEFAAEVETYASERPFYMLPARSSVVSSMDRAKSEVYFFDALGVEYLPFIQSKCEEYGLMYETSIARCELPSITSVNKDFLQYFDRVRDIKDLDELKHHSQIYDYQKCKLPIHLFRELEIIDRELKRIHAQLVQGTFEKAVIVADHGASRLAVLYGQESTSTIELEEKGIHSGRCCVTSEDPQIPSAAYEDGYAVLANYERFRGGRSANVEVHGGASLEEVVIPVITISKTPSDIVYCFVDPVIKFKMGQPARITLFCNMPMKQPRINVNGIFYDGVFSVDTKHAVFEMPEIKRTNEYVAAVYDGDKNLGISLNFSLERATKQINLFG